MERNENVEFFKNSEIRDIYNESACDHSMPDYKGEVKRVLHTSATVMPSGKFMDNSELCFSGVVLYSVVYLNGENKIEAEEFTSDYDFTVKYPTEHTVDFTEKTRIASMNVRVTGPRRFSAKCSLAADVCVTEQISMITEYNVGNEPLELARENVLALNKRSFYSQEREYAEKLNTFDGAIADDISVITSRATVNPTSVTRVADEACVKGNIAIDYIVSNGDIPPYAEHKSIPFEENVPVENISNEAVLCASGRISSLKLGVNPEDFGTNITADVISELCVDAIENREISFVSDGYVISCEGNPEYDEFSYNELIDVPVINESFEVSVKTDELGLGAIRDIVLVTASARIESSSVGCNGISVNGEIRFTGIASESDNENIISYSGFKYSAPMVLNANIDLQNRENLSAHPEITVSNPLAVLDKDSLVLSCDVKMSATLSEAKRTNRLSSLTAISDSNYEKCGSKLTVYYPDKDEDLFSIAKKFHTTLKDIAVSNALTESVINGMGKSSSVSVKKLIIK